MKFKAQLALVGLLANPVILIAVLGLVAFFLFGGLGSINSATMAWFGFDLFTPILTGMLRPALFVVGFFVGLNVLLALIPSITQKKLTIQPLPLIFLSAFAVAGIWYGVFGTFFSVVGAPTQPVTGLEDSNLAAIGIFGTAILLALFTKGGKK